MADIDSFNTTLKRKIYYNLKLRKSFLMTKPSDMKKKSGIKSMRQIVENISSEVEGSTVILKKPVFEPTKS